MGRPRVPPALRREWEQRLRESGYQDIERSDGSLTRAAHEQRAHIRAKRDDRRGDYYRLVAQWTWTHIWSSRLHRRMWELHTEGHGVRVIEGLMGPSRYRHHSTCWPVIVEARAALRSAGCLEDGNADEAPSLHAEELGTFPTFDRPTRRGHA